MDNYSRGRFSAIKSGNGLCECPRCGGAAVWEDLSLDDQRTETFRCINCETQWRNLGDTAGPQENTIIGSLGTLDVRAENVGNRSAELRMRTNLPHSENIEVPIFGKRRLKSSGGHANTSGPRPHAVTASFFERNDELGEDESLDEELVIAPKRGMLKPLMIAAMPVVAAAIMVPQLALQYQSDGGLPANIDRTITGSIGPGPEAILADVNMIKLVRGTESVLTVRGRVENPSNTRHVSGLLKVSIRDSAGKEVQSWHYRPGAQTIAPGTAYRFTTSALDLTGKADTVVIEPVSRTASQSN